MDNEEILKVLSEAVGTLPVLMERRDLWSSLIVNRRKPWTFRAFANLQSKDQNFRICLHRFEVCDEQESFLHPHPWPGAFWILKGSYVMNIGHSFDRVAKPESVAKIVLGPGSKYAITSPLTWHSVTPLEECYTVMVNGEPWDLNTAHREVRTTKGKDLDSMSADDLSSHFAVFKKLIADLP